MSRNDHHLSESGDIISGSLGEPAEIDAHITAIRSAVFAAFRQSARATEDAKRQFARAARDRETMLRVQTGRWSSLRVSNALADATELLIVSGASPKLTAAMAQRADKARAAESPYPYAIDDPAEERLNRPVDPSWIGARGEGEEL